MKLWHILSSKLGLFGRQGTLSAFLQRLRANEQINRINRINRQRKATSCLNGLSQSPSLNRLCQFKVRTKTRSGGVWQHPSTPSVPRWDLHQPPYPLPISTLSKVTDETRNTLHHAAPCCTTLHQTAVCCTMLHAAPLANVVHTPSPGLHAPALTPSLDSALKRLLLKLYVLV